MGILMIDIMDLLGSIENKEIFGHSLSSWILSLVILIIGIVLAKFFSHVTWKWTRSRLERHEQETFKKIVYYFVVIVFVMESLNNLGIDFSGVLVAGGVMGIVLGFASQTVVSNLISGIFMYFDKPLKIGDHVVIENVNGVVMDIDVLSTKIRTWDGNLVRIPNDKLFNSIIENKVSNEVRRIELSVGIAYKEDIDKAIETIRNVLNGHTYVLVEPSPVIFVNDLGDSSVNITIKAWSPNDYAYQTKISLLKLIKEAFDREGIEIPFPQRDIWIRKRD